MTLVTDTFIVATVIGRTFQEEYEHAWFAAFIAMLLLLVLLVPVTLLIGACMDMEEPFGDDPMDLPGLSYVSAAAEQTLALVAGGGLLADDEPGHESLLAGGPSPSAEALAGIAQVSADDLGLDDVRRRRLSAYPGA